MVKPVVSTSRVYVPMAGRSKEKKVRNHLSRLHEDPDGSGSRYGRFVLVTIDLPPDLLDYVTHEARKQRISIEAFITKTLYSKFYPTVQGDQS